MQGGVRVAHAHPVAAEQHAPLRQMLRRHVLEYQRAPAGGEHRANALLRGAHAQLLQEPVPERSRAGAHANPVTGTGLHGMDAFVVAVLRRRQALTGVRTHQPGTQTGADRVRQILRQVRRFRADVDHRLIGRPYRLGHVLRRHQVGKRDAVVTAGRTGAAPRVMVGGDGDPPRVDLVRRQEIEQSRGQRQQILVRVGNVDRERGPQPDAGQDRLHDAGVQPARAAHDAASRGRTATEESIVVTNKNGKLRYRNKTRLRMINLQ